jgi:hypothetical protein
MNLKRITTYSLLAHINNSGALITGLLEIFVPLIKHTLSEMNRQGLFGGESIMDIKEKVDETFCLDIPISVLRNVLIKIADEINTKDNVKLAIHKDNSFAIKNYVFTDFDELVNEKQKDINDLEVLFKEFLKINGVQKHDSTSIFEFIELNKVSLSRYLSDKSVPTKQKDFSIEAKFIEFFRPIPNVYNLYPSRSGLGIHGSTIHCPEIQSQQGS